MNVNNTIQWLMDGDVSIQYQVSRDILDENRPDLQKRIETEGWGAEFLKFQNPNGHWGKEYYNPKWISTHYTLLTLKNLAIDKNVASIHSILHTLLYKDRKFEAKQKDFHKSVLYDDVCVNGMFLNFASYFLGEEPKLMEILDFILSQQMEDGGFNCQKNRSGARHSSMHSTLSVLEGLHEFIKQGNTYRQDDIKHTIKRAEEFLLMHKLYLSDRTGKVINAAFLRFPYPCRWRYDIMRAMDYFQDAGRSYDERMEPAIDYILSKRTAAGRWKVNAKYPGKSFFIMDKAGKESRINTMRALRIMKKYLGYTGLDLIYNDLIDVPHTIS
ncbi:MAG: hypothetical protein P1U56_21420 [Saprospiraceae bacterium]|nr:hypothetical protein [Saprospiraceae bacterium]